jgi:hypothetical protein
MFPQDMIPKGAGPHDGLAPFLHTKNMGKKPEPSKPAEPIVEPSKPAEPVAEPSKPAEPVAEPPKPAEPVAEPPKPAEPVAEPSKPVESTTVIDSVPDDFFPEVPPVAPVTPEEKPRIGRPPGARNKPKLMPDAASVIPTAEKIIDYSAMSAMIFDMSTGTLILTFGPEWKPRDENERNCVVGCLAAYLKSKDVQDIPPGMMLTIVCLAYAAPRLREPNTAGKIKGFFSWIKGKFVKRKSIL